MRIPLILLGGIVVLSVAVARALSCVCSPLECDLLTTEDCPGGLTWDPCKCCKVCARVEGEPCGGLFGFSGSCAVGLQCVIRNLLDHTREVDEGTCTKIPGRWRRHCQHGPRMSGPGCNLVDEGIATETGNVLAAGRCVCGPSVPWCLGEPRPYTFATRHECKLNLAAKIAYDDLFSFPDKEILDGSRGLTCPEDSVALEDGGCKCVSPCPPDECRAGQRPVQVRAASPETPGSCCPLYNCIPSESVSWAGTDEGQGTGRCMDTSGVPRSAGERWQEGPCVNCVCEEGNVSCQATMCRSCESPIPAAPGECCPHCPPPLQNATGIAREKCEPLRNCELHCLDGYEKDKSGCSTCSCTKEKPTTEKPATEGRICPELPHCRLDCELVKDKGGCSVCVCENSHSKDVSMTTKVQKNDNRTVCPALSCDLHCEHGLVNDENGCTLCECKEQVGCTPLTDCKKRCSFGLKTNKRGCQICRCRAACVDHRNETHPEGSTWMPNSCTTCVCDSIGRLSCKEIVCSVACSDPLSPEPGTCCPICPITVPSSTEVTLSHQNSRGWGTAPITVIVVLAVFCVLLMLHIIRSRFRGRLSPSEATYASYPPQYYKCLPAYDTPAHQNEKIIPL